MKAKHEYLELVNTEVINPAFEPSPKDYARAFLFQQDYFAGKKKFVVTSKPYLWALTLQKSLDWDFQTMPREVRTEVEKLSKKTPARA